MSEAGDSVSTGSNQREYEFALVLEGLGDLTDEVMDRLFEAGCGDATFSLRYGRVFAEFGRAAGSYAEALFSAIRDVRRAEVGAELLRVNECDLVTAADIARRIDRSRQLVSQYIKGERGPGGFPAPECWISEEQPLWAWCAVSYWLVENQLARAEVYEEARLAWVVNEWLAGKRMRAEEGGAGGVVERVEAELG
jgi:hypothetical protein